MKLVPFGNPAVWFGNLESGVVYTSPGYRALLAIKANVGGDCVTRMYLVDLAVSEIYEQWDMHEDRLYTPVGTIEFGDH